MKSVYALLFLLLLPLGAIADAQKYAAFDTYLTAALENHGVVGASVALIHGGEVTHLTAAGRADAQALMRPQTVMQVASISKPVAAWAVMTAVEDGVLDLDTPVATYLTRWQLPDSDFDASGVTLRRLLSHTAGLSLGGYPGFPPEVERPTVTESLAGDTNGAGAVFLQSTPGTEWSYSGGGYTLIQLIIEEATGQAFADYARERVLTPLGMSTSDYQPSAELLARAATAYDSHGKRVPSYRFTAQAAAALHTTAEDLGRFVVANLGEQTVLSPASVELLHTAVPESGGWYGLGFVAQEDGDIVWHNGGNIGWRARLSLSPSADAGIVVLTNGNNGMHLIQDVLCFWSESFEVPAYATDCADAQAVAAEQAGQARIVIAVFLVLLALAFAVLAWRLRRDDVAWQLPPLMSLRALGASAALAASGFLWLAWNTSIVVQAVSGFPHTYGRDLAPTAFWPLHALTLALLLVLGLFAFTRKTPRPSST
ncbi:MAG: serine hydrolase domain-containing protein [Pseudomonadota bacterium]